MSLTQTQNDAIAALRAMTYGYITAYMPEWRQLKWNLYIGYFDRGIQNLEGYEKAVAATMLDEGQSHREAYQKAKKGLAWLGMCTVRHDNLEKQIRKMPDDHIKNLNLEQVVSYPAWPFKGE